MKKKKEENESVAMNISDIVGEVITDAVDDRYYSHLEALLEHNIDELIRRYHVLVGPLKTLMEMECGETAAVNGPSPKSHTGGSEFPQCFAMGMTYFSLAIMRGHAAGGIEDSEISSLILTLVEQHLLSQTSGAYKQLRGHAHALQRFGQLLKGYIDLLDHSDVGNHLRKLSYLQSAVTLFSPSTNHLTVAHPLLVREAARSNCPAPALTVMRQPILELSCGETGAGLACCCSYYYEGGLLLAAMQCWESSVSWLRNSLSLVKVVLRVGSPEPKVVSATPSLSLDDTGSIIVSATKAFVLLCISVYGDWGDAADHMRVQQVIQQYRNSNVGSYVRLLVAAQRRDFRQWHTIKRNFSPVWEQDGTVSLLATAESRLQRHVVLDIAKVYSRVRLSTIASALRVCCLSETEGGGNTSSGSGDSGESTQGKINAVELLLSMREDGELIASVEHVPRREESEEEAELSGAEETAGDISAQQQHLAVRLAIPPRRIPAELGESCKGLHDLHRQDGENQHVIDAEIQGVLHGEIERCKRAYAALMKVAMGSRGVVPPECEEAQVIV